MLKTNKVRFIKLLCFLFLFYLSHGQELTPTNRNNSKTTLYNTLSDSAFVSLLPKGNSLHIDSIINQKATVSSHSIDKDSLRDTLRKGSQFASFARKPLLHFRGGYITYNWSYRSNIDTPFLERNISQHFLTGNLSFTIAQSIPIRLIYFGRQTNSQLFKDFNDFRVEFDAPEFSRLRRERLTSYVNSIIEQIRDPFLKPSLDGNNRKLNRLGDWLTNTSVVNALLRSREKVLLSNIADTVISDSALQAAKAFIAYYDNVKQTKEKLGREHDSLMQCHIRTEKTVQKLKQVISNHNTDPTTWNEADNVLNERGISSPKLLKMLKGHNPIKTFAFGKTMPSFTNLTVKNIGVKGINYEYNNHNLYMAVTAGAIDYRIKDFIYKKQKKVPEYLYAIRFGYGSKESNNLIVTYFGGKRQIFSNALPNKATEINGVSLSSQWLIGKRSKIIIEVAQSVTAPTIDNGLAQKPYFSIHNQSSSAYSFQLKSVIPIIKTKVEGLFQHNGMDFQSFTSYKVNATTDRWFVKGEQSFWKNQLYVNGMVQKNDFNNPLIQQRYNTNTIFKSVSATFRKRRWPSLTLGYMPSSQYTVVDNDLFESHYQILNATLNHQYKIGIARGSSSFMYNRFFNNSLDSGFVFYNSSNFYLNQGFYFSHYSTFLTISHSYSNQYTLNVLDMALQAQMFGQENWGIGTKVNLLNSSETKVGYYATIGLGVKKIGNLSVRVEKSYLPTYNHSLAKSDFYNVGFTRYIQ